MAEVLRKLVVGPLDVNCYVVGDSRTREALVIDPGGDAGRIEKAVKKEGLKVKYIINTHGHFDHVGANAELKSAFGAPVAIHAKDAPLLLQSAFQSSAFGVGSPNQSAPDMLLEDGAILDVGALIFEVLHTPGHTEGGVCLFLRKEGILFTGDTLFAGSVGRTDLYGGSQEKLMESLKKIRALGDEIRVYPGHGPGTTIGEEKEINPFMSWGNFL